MLTSFFEERMFIFSTGLGTNLVINLSYMPWFCYKVFPLIFWLQLKNLSETQWGMSEPYEMLQIHGQNLCLFKKNPFYKS